MTNRIRILLACSMLLLVIVTMAAPVHAQPISSPTLQDRIALTTNWLLNYVGYNYTTVDDLGKTLVFFSDLRQVLPNEYSVDRQMATLTSIILQHVTSNFTFSYLDPYGRFISQDFGWWNAFVAEAIAIAASRMLANPNLKPSDRVLYLNATGTVERMIEKWGPIVAQWDGSWFFEYPLLGKDDTLDANAMMLVALTTLSNYEHGRGDPLHQTLELAAYASKIANWILSRQEKRLQWLRGGFYNDDMNQTIYTDSNARAVFALITYANLIDSLAPNSSPNRNQVMAPLQFWTNFIPYSSYAPASSFGMRDRYDYGPYWYVTKCSSSPTSLEVGVNGTVYDTSSGFCFFRYPKETWRAAVVGRALLGLYNSTSNANLILSAIYYYSWMTGNNELQTDLQQTVGEVQGMAMPYGALISPGKGGFWVGIKRSGWMANATHVATTLMPSHAPLESTAESGDFLIRLLDKWTGYSWLLETATLQPIVSQTGYFVVFFFLMLLETATPYRFPARWFDQRLSLLAPQFVQNLTLGSNLAPHIAQYV